MILSFDLFCWFDVNVGYVIFLKGLVRETLNDERSEEVFVE